MKEATRLEFLSFQPGRSVAIACSGGPDSMALADWYFRHTEKRIKLLFFHHGTSTSTKSLRTIREAFHTVWDCLDIKEYLELIVGNIATPEKPKGKSWEEHWRDERLAWLNSFNIPVLTAHNLDDAVETWIWSSLHGEGKLIPYKNNNIRRPLLLTKKSTLKQWCDSSEVPYYEDPDNKNRKFMRSIVRHDIMPHALRVNPGIYKVVKKKILAMKNEEGTDVIRA